jgi:hypothetical protein
MKMIWSEEDIDKIDEKLQRLITASGIDEYYNQVPNYIFGPNWTDELRVKNGYEQVEGVWVQRESVADYWSTKMNDVRSLMKEKNRLFKELQLVRLQMREMEYGLRVAQKSLGKALNMTEVSDE